MNSHLPYFVTWSIRNILLKLAPSTIVHEDRSTKHPQVDAALEDVVVVVAVDAVVDMVAAVDIKLEQIVK